MGVTHREFGGLEMKAMHELVSLLILRPHQGCSHAQPMGFVCMIPGQGCLIIILLLGTCSSCERVLGSVNC